MVNCSRCGELFAGSLATAGPGGLPVCPRCGPADTPVNASPPVGEAADGGPEVFPVRHVPQALEETPPPVEPVAGGDVSPAGGDKPPESGWSQTSKELWWLNLLISYFAGLPIVEVIFKALSPGALGPDEAVQLGSVFIATAPLTAAVAASIWLVATWPSPGALAATGFIFLTANWVGNELALGVAPATANEVDGGAALHHTFGYLSGYADAYGPALFMSGLAIGVYAGVKFHLLAKETA